MSHEFWYDYRTPGKKDDVSFAVTRIDEEQGWQLESLSEGDAPVSLTEDQRKLLECRARLNKDQQEVIFALIDKMQV